jgi:hypothetical protein
VGAAVVTDPAEVVTTRLRGQAGYCDTTSPFYAVLLRQMADDVDARGPTWDLLRDTADDPAGFVPQLRLLGAVHALALRGDAPELAARYPSCGGDGDAAAAWPALRAALADRHDELVPWLARPPQTNEVGRAAALIVGLLTATAATPRPVRLLEIGASAGLNLRLDRFWYEADGRGVGDAASPVRFVDCWEGGRPPLDAPLHVESRLGCDRNPIDSTSEEGRTALLAYTWPDMHDRLALLRAALDVAAHAPAVVEQADFGTWLPDQLAEPAPGRLTVVQHSIVLQYCDAETIRGLRDTLHDAGARATADAPLAWLRLEPRSMKSIEPQLRLTTWPGGAERVLATAPFHLGPVRLGSPDEAQPS